jgi:hypothetical protein
MAVLFIQTIMTTMMTATIQTVLSTDDNVHTVTSFRARDPEGLSILRLTRAIEGSK